MSNYAFVRGIDRLIDVAAELKRRGRADVLFAIAGTTTLSGSLPGRARPKWPAQAATLRIMRAGAASAKCFVSSAMWRMPESVVLAGDLIAKPTREYNPWGRDILEAMAFGKPAISVGTYGRFVENGVTGILHAEFDAEQWADEIARLADESHATCQRSAGPRRSACSNCATARRAPAICAISGPASSRPSAKKPCAA